MPKRDQPMIRLHQGLMILVAGLVFSGATSVNGQDSQPAPAALDKLPSSASAILNSQYPGAEVLAVMKESDNGKVCYRVMLMHKGHERSAYIAPDGKFIG